MSEGFFLCVCVVFFQLPANSGHANHLCKLFTDVPQLHKHHCSPPGLVLEFLLILKF